MFLIEFVLFNSIYEALFAALLGGMVVPDPYMAATFESVLGL